MYAGIVGATLRVALKFTITTSGDSQNRPYNVPLFVALLCLSY